TPSRALTPGGPSPPPPPRAGSLPGGILLSAGVGEGSGRGGGGLGKGWGGGPGRGGGRRESSRSMRPTTIVPHGEILPTGCHRSITNVLPRCCIRRSGHVRVCTVTTPRRVPRHAGRAPPGAATRSRPTHPGGTLKIRRTAQAAAVLAAGSLVLAAC